MPSPEPTKQSTIITTSSWRAGKQLADRVLRERQPKRSVSPPLSSSSSLISSVEPSTSATADEPLSTWTKKTTENRFADILVDLEMEDAEDVRKEEKKTGSLKRTQTGSGGARKKQKSNEPTYPAERVRHYDPTEVQAYIQRQKEQRKKKAVEKRQSQTQATTERQKKLQELYETQRKRVELNLRRKQKKREDYAKSLASGIHIHLHDPAISTSPSEGSLPTLTITQAPRTPRYSPRRLNTDGASPRLHTSHLTPSPPTHSSPKTSPLRHSRLRSADGSPLKGQRSSQQPSPRTYTFQQSTSPRRAPTEHAQSHSSPPHTDTVYMPSPPKSPRTYDERLQAIRASALRLKERIAKESKKVLDESYEGSSQEVPRYHHQANKQGPTPVDLPGVQNVREHALLAEQQKQRTNAALKIQAAYRGYNVRKSLKWATPTTGALSPSRRPISTPVIVVSPSADQTSTRSTSSASKTSTSPSRAAVRTSTSPSRAAVRTSASPSGAAVEGTLPTTVEPWKQGGGDRHSVINVFTREHAKLRETISLLSDKKREEIRGLSASQTEQAPVSSPPRVASDGTASSYSQKFEPDPSHDDTSVHSVSSVSLSQDSLYTQPSPPRPTDQTTPTSQHHSPSLSPDSKGQRSQSRSTSDRDMSVTPTNDIPAITPPGTPSFVDSFSSATPRPTPVLPAPSVPTGRLSPRSLELKHQAQLNLYETVEEHLRHLSHVERARDLSVAQQETVTLAEQLKAQEQAHKTDLSALASKAKRDIDAAQRKLESEGVNSADKMRQLEERMNTQVKKHSQRLAELQAESERAAREATLRLNEARSSATSAVIEAAQQQIQAAHTMAVSVASAATKEAVREALRREQRGGSPERSAEYESDFDPSTMRPDSLNGSDDEVDQTTAAQGTGGETSQDTTLTAPPTEAIPPAIEATLVDGEEPQEVPEDISEVSFRELLPSESHRKRHDPDTPSTRPHTPSQGDQSPYSPAGEDSFFMFTSRMMTEYMKEEELRAKHRAALLELREKALKEKTELKLKWIQLKQRDIRSKGADDLMPPLKEKEQGVLRGFRKEQAEIQRLKQAQAAATHERRLILQEQQEISQIRKSTQYYRDKIRGYRGRSHASPSPAPSDMADHSLFSDAIEATPTSEQATPSEHLEPGSFPTYSSQMEDDQSIHSSTSLSEHLRSSQERSVQQEASTKSPDRRSDSGAFKHLQKNLTSTEAERYLAERKLSIDKRRQAAEEVIQRHRELLKKEQELDKEEESVNKLVDEAMEMLRQTPLSANRGPTTRGLLQETSVLESLSSSAKKPSVFVTEQPSGSVVEEMSPSSAAGDRLMTVSTELPSEYAADTFESLHTSLTAHPVTTSTPEKRQELALDNSLRATESITESLTTTSSGSGLEERIRALKEQLRQRKEEVKKVQNHQKRKKKAILRQQEEKLKKQLEAVDLKAQQTTTPPPLTLSPTMSELESQDHTPLTSEPEYHAGTSREGSPVLTDHTASSRVTERSESAPSRESSPVSASSEASIPEESLLRESSNSPAPSEDNQSTPVHDNVSEHVEETLSYTPFSTEKASVKDATLTPCSAERANTELEGPESDDIESKMGSVEALIPPPGFEGLDELSIPKEQIEAANDESKNTLEQEYPTETPVHEYTADFEPDTHQDGLEARSDISLPISISGSRGGDSEEELNYRPGQRVIVGGVMEGVVKFVGKTHFAPGLWIGVVFNEPRGRHDGSIDDQRYFTCPPKHGIFAPPRKVNIIEDTAEEPRASPLAEDSPAESTVAEELESDDAPMSEHSEDKSQDSEEDQYLDDFEPELEKSLDLHSPDNSLSSLEKQHPSDRPTTDKQLEPTAETFLTSQVSEQISKLSESSVPSEQAPAEVEVIGEKPDSLPSAPESLVQQHATPTPAPPPEFAEGASREGSTEPPATLDHKQDKITDELTQELMNEAYETMHQIWRSKQHGVDTETKADDVEPPASQSEPSESKPVDDKSIVTTTSETKPAVVQVPRDKEVLLSLDQKADRITDQLLALLLRSESSLMTNIHSSKVVTQEQDKQTEPTSPPSKRHPPLRISISNIKESSPPPLSPPSPYRIPPAVMPGDHSPPGSPPCHLSQLSAARVVAGEKTPLSQQEIPTPAKLERASSTDSIVQLLDTVKVTTAQCMVPSERLQVDEVVKEAWTTALTTGLEHIHTQEVHCPQHTLSLFKDTRELSREEEHCHKAYIQLVFDLAIDVIKQLHPVDPPCAVWLHGTVRRTSNGPRATEPPSLELVQKRVYAALIRGQLPLQLPTVKFLHGKRRPGGKEVDFVDGILIKELRFEEPSWIDYHKDETTVKIRTADSILDSLLTETVEIMQNIEQKRKH